MGENKLRIKVSSLAIIVLLLISSTFLLPGPLVVNGGSELNEGPEQTFGSFFSLPMAIIGPNTTINIPQNNTIFKSLNGIYGTCDFDNVTQEITKIEICIERINGSMYWNGTGWNGLKTWLLATGNVTWSYNSNSVTWTSGKQYLIQSKATDNLSNVEIPSFGNIFTFDNSKPSSTITTPAYNSSMTSLSTISGNAFDTGGAGLNYIYICIKRVSDNYYWGGSNWSTGQNWLGASGTNNWNYFPSISWTPGKYIVRSRATDNVYNVEIPGTGNPFTIVLGTNPSSTINVPSHNSIHITLNSISGVASAATNATVSKVEITIQRISDSKYWHGSSWNASLNWLLTSGTTSWSYNSSTVSWSTSNQYRIRSRATDNNSGVETPSSGNVFFLNSSATPSSQIDSPKNYGYYSYVDRISGTAWEINNLTMSISKVELEIKNQTNGKYWNGTTWLSGQVWLLVTNGTTSWNYDTSMITWKSNTRYDLRSRATDNLSNVETNIKTTRFYFDNIKPSSTILVPGNNTILTNLMVNGSASDTGGSSIRYVHVFLKRKSDNMYWSGYNWTKSQTWLFASGKLGWMFSLYNVSWSIGTYLMRSKATDNAYNVESPSYGTNFTVTSIFAIPSSSINTPNNNSYVKSLNSISGTATGPGTYNVSKVEITIYCIDNNKYWTGSTWSSSQTWLLCSGTNSWQYGASSVSWTSGFQYRIRSKATYNTSCVEKPKWGVKFTFDYTKPSSTITFPLNNSKVNSLNSINGTATDFGGKGLRWVHFCLKRNSDNKYWHNNSWYSSKFWLLASGKTNWIYYFFNITLTPGTYHVQSRATDTLYNVEVPKYGIIFTYGTTTKPSSAINTPTNNSYMNTLISISGSAVDNSGSGLKSVELTIKRKVDNYYWSGSAWSTSQSWLTASGTTSWSYNTSPVSWTSDYQYSIYSRAIDNTSTIGSTSAEITFMFDNTVPTSLSISINSGAKNTKNRTVFLSLQAKDLGSGVAQMSFSNDNTNWSAWETYNTNKTYLLTSGDGLKTVYFKVKDRAGNIANSVSDNITLDTKAPSIFSIVIYRVNLFTNSRQINFIMKLEDIKARMYKIAFSTDGLIWSTWQVVWSEKNTSSRSRASPEVYELSVEYILPEGDGPKTVYYRVQDDAGNTVESVFDEIILDTTPPEDLSISINNDAEYTNSESVILSLGAIDALSGYNKMSFSTDGIDWSDWEIYKVSKAMALTTGDGEKKIYYRVSDEVGNIAEPISDSIILDTTPPYSLSLIINDGASETNSTYVSLKLSAFDDTSGLDMMAFSLNGKTWENWQDFTETRYYILSDVDGEKTVYFRVKDKVGNVAEPVSVSIILNTETHELTKDSDEDGVDDKNDAFPFDPAASVDSDRDGSPDIWNKGKTEDDSTTGLHLDMFPNDPAASVDIDGDLSPDYWNLGKSVSDSTTYLHLDMFPTDPAASKDSDEDGYPDDWNPGMSEDDSNSDLELDAYPEDPNKHTLSVTRKKSEPSILPLILILIIIVIIILLILMIVVVKKRHQPIGDNKPYDEDKLLWKLRNEIIYGKGSPNAELSDTEISEKLEAKFRAGEISEYTYSLLKNQ